MLQLNTAGFKALDNLRTEKVFPPKWQNMDELEKLTDDSIFRFLAERLKVSKELGGGFLLQALLDQTLRTQEIEHMDNQNIPESEKLEMVRALDRQNTVMRLYSRYIDILLPLIFETAERTKREIRVLELASGSGGLALALGEAVQQKNLPVSITGSDIVQAYIEEGNSLAAEKNIPVNFRYLNALDMNELSKEVFDIILISQSLHHFTPGQLSVMIAQSLQHATTAFVGIDGYRSMLLACGIPLIAGLQGIMSFALDGFTSARKFYTALELDMIAEIATGKRNHNVTCSWPLSVLSVRF
ncbi:MAG: class I SAM-dependent methyltransferase [Chlorobiaceae bacterium]